MIQLQVSSKAPCVHLVCFKTLLNLCKHIVSISSAAAHNSYLQLATQCQPLRYNDVQFMLSWAGLFDVVLSCLTC